MYNIKRTNSDDIDFQNLVIELDKDLAIRDGEEHDFFAQFNKISAIKNVVVLYENEIAVGCGAIKEYEENVMEIKRMFVPLEKRGKGIAFSKIGNKDSACISLEMAKTLGDTDAEKEIESTCK